MSESRVNLYPFFPLSPFPRPLLFFLSVFQFNNKKKKKWKERERETRQMFYFGEGATRAAGRMSGRGQLRKSGLFFFVEC